jgi:predicted P-loop ATPase
MTLTPSDLAMFAKIRVPPELLHQAKIQRVSDCEAREKLGINGKSGDMAGVLFPYLHVKTGYPVSHRVRRDHPEIEDGKPRNKYMAGYGDRRHLYFVPGSEALCEDRTVPAVLVEAEKSALAIWAWSQRTGKRVFAIAMGGCYGWRGRIGITTDEKGERVNETGALPDLDWCKKRLTYVLLDANCAGNPKVLAARRELAKALGKKGADVRILNLPASEGINGPDDFVGAMGDAALLELFNTGTLAAKDGQSNKSLLANALALLRESPEWAGVLAYNEFTLYVTTKKPAPWQKVPGGNWSDYDDTRTTEWLQRHEVPIANTALTAEAVQCVAKDNSFHPVRDYFNGLTWDQAPRLTDWLSKYLGAFDSEFLRAIGPRWMISGVARIFEPGCQADHVLLLEGPQGIRKSSALQTLAGANWFTDHISDLGSKDSRIELHGKLIIEFSELAAARRGETERNKAFLTAREDNFRMPYARRSEAVPRSCVFAATTNDATPFVDATGNRRFWPVRCGSIDVAGLKADRDQLWAEAVARYRAGEPWWLDTDALNQFARNEQDERFDPGVWDDVILGWVENPTQRETRDGFHGDLLPITPFDSEPGKVTITDVLLHCVGKDLDRLTQPDRNQVQRCLTHAGWTRKQIRSGPKRGKWFYIRPIGTSGTSMEPVLEPVVSY